MKVMRSRLWMRACGVVLVGVAGWAAASGAGKKVELPELGEEGRKLEARYEAMLRGLQGGIARALPAIDAETKAGFVAVCAAEKEAEGKLDRAQKSLNKSQEAAGLVRHAHGWIDSAEKEIVAAEGKIKKAGTDAERAAAEAERAKAVARRDVGKVALIEREAGLMAAKREEPYRKKDVEIYKAELEAARAKTVKTLEGLKLGEFLANDALDERLVKLVVLKEATPRGLAAFAEQGAGKAEKVEMLLGDAALMKRMVMADGAAGGKYGRAMEILAAIRRENERSYGGAPKGALGELALAVALEHAEPVKQANPKAKTDGPETVDPVKRYIHFAEAFRAGELDPAFEKLGAWEMRFVVDGDEPDATLAWGREMLRNYRPDHVRNADYKWRYVEAVRTEVRYGSEDVVLDRPELQGYQNMIMNGGVCGRRAFFGRFILRSFGIPTIARPQPKHAALAHWTPEGWVVNLGAAWGWGWTKTRYGRDVDFLATTQARRDMAAYMQIKRAQWIGDAAGEKAVFGLQAGKPQFWYAVSLYRQRQMIAEAKALAAEGEEFGEADGPAGKADAVKVREEDKLVTVETDGTITLPAVAISKPARSTGKIRLMPGMSGGSQLHYGRLGGAESFEYTFDSPAAGKFSLTAKVVTTSDRQHFMVTANGAKEAVDLAVPYTCGKWETTGAVEVELVKGRNVLTFSHRAEGQAKGVTVKEFVMKAKGKKE